MPAARPLAGLLAHVPGAVASGGMDRVRITGISYDSARVRPGHLFVAIRGTRTDGHDFIADAVRRGAAAVVVEREVEGATAVPVVRVPDGRRALAELAAAWHGHPAERLRLVGITGTVGKTSVLCMLEAIWTEAGRPLGSVGSFGVRIAGQGEETGFTVPDPLVLHGALAGFAEAGCDLAAMEVTTHALDQQRVHGLRYDLGVFTNLLPLEHTDYHGSFRQYADAKVRFFGHLRPGAPLVHDADDPVVRALVREHWGTTSIGCGTDPRAEVRVEGLAADPEGSRLRLRIRRPLPGMDGDRVLPREMELRLRVPGRAGARNATLAAATALCCGVDPAHVERALAAFQAPPRRMETVYRGDFTVLDDTVYHPDSISALWEVVERLAPRRLHVVYAVRGQRGDAANRRAAEALAIWGRRSPLATLIATRSVGTTGARNRVTDEERAAFVEPLRRAGLPLEEHDRLDRAVIRGLQGAGPGDVVLLLGAQGMEGGADVARAWLKEGGGAPPPR